MADFNGGDVVLARGVVVSKSTRNSDEVLAYGLRFKGEGSHKGAVEVRSADIVGLADAPLGPVADQQGEYRDAARARAARFADMYELAYFDIQKVLDQALGTKEEDGAGGGIAADVHLLMGQRDQARAEITRLRAELDEARRRIADGLRECDLHADYVGSLTVLVIRRALIGAEGGDSGGERFRQWLPEESQAAANKHRASWWKRLHAWLTRAVGGRS